MERRIRAVAADLDGTLLDNSGNISEGTRRALKALEEAGIPVVIATGRPLCALPEQVLAAEGIRYLITANGALACKREGKLVGQSLLSRSLREGLLELALREGTVCEMFSDGRAYADSRVTELAARWGYPRRTCLYLERTRELREDLERLLLETERVEAVDIFVRDQRQREGLRERLSKTPGLYVTSSVPHLVETAAEGTSKAAALEQVLSREGISLEETAAFGDGDNDVELLAACGLGIAMENGSPACRAAADRTTAGNGQDGVAEEIWRLLGEK